MLSHLILNQPRPIRQINILPYIYISKEKIDYHQIQYKKHHHSILNRKEQKQLRNNKNCRQLKYEYSPLLKYIRLEKGIITNNTQYKQIKNQIK